MSDVGNIYTNALARDDVAWLAARVEGAVMLPSEDGYAEECATYNLSLSLRPAVVVAAASEKDVAAAVTFAAERGLAVAVKTTGHQIPLPADGAVLVTTRRMKGVTVDAERQTVRVEAGALWQEVVDAAAREGLAPLCGSAPGVGVAGYVLGGGQSPVLGRSRGFAADHVRSLEVVTANGEMLTVDAGNEPDLFWALRGGKGNFAVVTSLELDLFPVTRFYGGGLYFPGERTAEVLHAWRTWVSDLPEEMTSSVSVLRLPPDPALPEPLRGAFTVHVRVAHLGPAADAERLVAPLRALGPVLLDTLSDKPFRAIGEIHADPVDPLPYWDRTTMLRELPAEAIDALVEVVGPDSGCALAAVEIRSLGGAFDRPPAVPNAVSTRGLPFVVFAFGVGAPDQAISLRARLARVVDVLRPWSAERKMINFLSADEATTADGVEEAYGPELYRRLAEVKKAYDPANVFRLFYNIPPG
ncbi:FAD-binding oxidoreductase [Actinoallomurus acaciae]|uniref:FAD-binding oxidoreductase n=1 Tax=Actinoallomurus acaciae TaxID=502577 RepID=A0ABV5YC97_9ACTN